MEKEIKVVLDKAKLDQILALLGEMPLKHALALFQLFSVALQEAQKETK